MRKTFDAELHELGAEMIDMAAAAEDAVCSAGRLLNGAFLCSARSIVLC